MQPPLCISNQEDAALYSHLIRDVCYLFHELSAYRHIMGDLDYAKEYTLDYWALLNRIDTGRPDDRFIRSGILILTLAMLSDVFDGSGDSISLRAAAIRKAVDDFIPEDTDMLRLAEAVLHGLGRLESPTTTDSRFESDLCWAYDSFVRAYFAANAS